MPWAPDRAPGRIPVIAPGQGGSYDEQMFARRTPIGAPCQGIWCYAKESWHGRGAKAQASRARVRGIARARARGGARLLEGRARDDAERGRAADRPDPRRRAAVPLDPGSARLRRERRPAVSSDPEGARPRLLLSVLDGAVGRRHAVHGGGQRDDPRKLLGIGARGLRHRLCRARADQADHVGGARHRRPAAGDHDLDGPRAAGPARGRRPGAASRAAARSAATPRTR